MRVSVAGILLYTFQWRFIQWQLIIHFVLSCVLQKKKQQTCQLIENKNVVLKQGLEEISTSHCGING
jgi:hypothetical protein